MTDAPPPDPPKEGDLYEPESVMMQEGELYIPDIVDFAEVLNCIAWQWVKGELFILDRESHKWVNVECGKRPLKSVQ